MSDSTEWTPPADPVEEVPGDPGADLTAADPAGRPAVLESIPSYLESAEGALTQCRKIAPGAAGGNVAAAAAMHAFAAVAQAFATLHLAEQTSAATRRTETERA